MSTGIPKRKRAERKLALPLPPGFFERLGDLLRRRDVLARLAACAVAMFLMWAITGGWRPPFRYRAGDVPPRSIVASVDFSVTNKGETEKLREAARRSVEVTYEHDPQPLIEKLGELKGKVLKILEAKSFTELDEEVKKEFFDRSMPNDPAMFEDLREDKFQNFRLGMESDPDAKEFEAAVKRAMLDYLTNGLLEELDHGQEDGTLLQIKIIQGSESPPRLISTEDVRIREIRPELEKKLQQELKSEQISEPIYFWLSKQLPPTLKRTDRANKLTTSDQEQAAEKVPDKMIPFKAGESVLVEGGKPLLGAEQFELLDREYDERLNAMTPLGMLAHSLADFGMYLALYVLCGFYIYYHQPRLLTDWRRFVSLLGLVVATVAMAWWMRIDAARAESIPLILFAMTAAIAYRQEVALLLSPAICAVFTISSGQGLAEFITLLAPMAVAVLLLGRVRSRTKLLYVGLFAGAAAFLTSMGVGTLVGQNIGEIPLFDGSLPVPALLLHSLWRAGCAVLAGLLMTGLLPFVEYVFDVQTDISLLELGDAAHPLLQELVRRAPGTYNHSINVASIAEAAADAIGANGLLCRVGAYFHDIGKMLKPGYFVENQSVGGNRHESLMPAMSTLVIIAHVKDGADLARQHGLPQAIIDFIQQHHGTTLVEYFYRQASQQSEGNPDAAEVEESDFRYPGPKPQTREAGVMMLADAVESASRTLVDPTPSRIESLVEDIAMKRLLDGQFDESSLTLSQLRVIQDSLVKSLTAVYHGRVKYPDQQTA